ncbi:alkene reductase [Sphingomonas sp. SRS2]|uniref:alkene reductase n=1 Tax=Sphingomonas sp. SRS2 TaxID=133190 RepID=UPI0006184EE9|nr:alkene reductase [Sphingomonas sp. SRS2]KKC27041.1 N-ethylmaleimide reductase [Sphingomonas sp. SRS2]
MPTLFDPITLGAIDAPNRIIMAPLTRARASRAAVPTPVMAEYYAQRASAGLIITEATGISRTGLGWPDAPGIWNDEQVVAWRRVTDAVHAAGGRIVSQIWHMGRLVHPSIGGEQPISSSPIAAPNLAHTYEGKQPYVVPRPLGSDEIPALLADFAHAARNAIAAGFDGVQIHAANGYLIDQFLRDSVNKRDDAYGGSIENRLRLLGEVTHAVADVVGPGRTSVRLSPNGEAQGVDDSNPEPLFTAASRLLADIGIGFLEVREPQGKSSFRAASHPPIAPAMRKAFNGNFILNSDYDRAGGEAALDLGLADAISFGRPFIANPDLPRRFAEGLPLASGDVASFYSGGPEGYVDYPAAA